MNIPVTHINNTTNYVSINKLKSEKPLHGFRWPCNIYAKSRSIMPALNIIISNYGHLANDLGLEITGESKYLSYQKMAQSWHNYKCELGLLVNNNWSESFSMKKITTQHIPSTVITYGIYGGLCRHGTDAQNTILACSRGTCACLLWDQSFISLAATEFSLSHQMVN